MENGSSPIVCAIDIGSNSIHMIVARVENGRFRVLDSDKVLTSLFSRLEDDGRFTQETIDLVCASILSMKEIACTFEPFYRVVATQAVRQAHNYLELLHAIKETSHIHVDLIDGNEEARYSALGIHCSMSSDIKKFFGSRYWRWVYRTHDF